MRLAASFLVGFVYVFFFSPYISAQEQQKTEISVSPAVVEVAADPGDQTTRSITIRNNGDLSQPISYEVQSLIKYEGFFDSTNKLSDASEWISTEESAQIFEPGEIKNIELNFNIPEDASPGGHYAQLTVRALVLESSSSSQSSIVIPEITVSIFVVVSGDIKESLAFVDNNIFPLFTEPGKEEMISFNIDNLGNTHDIATPILIAEKDGIEIERQQLDSKIILPSTTKNFIETINFPKMHGKYNYRIEVKEGSTENLASSTDELVIVTYSITRLLGIGICTFLIIHMIRYRRNFNKAYTILRYGKNIKK